MCTEQTILDDCDKVEGNRNTQVCFFYKEPTRVFRIIGRTQPFHADITCHVWNRFLESYMVDTGILSNNMKSLSL